MDEPFAHAGTLRTMVPSPSTERKPPMAKLFMKGGVFRAALHGRNDWRLEAAAAGKRGAGTAAKRASARRDTTDALALRRAFRVEVRWGAKAAAAAGGSSVLHELHLR